MIDHGSTLFALVGVSLPSFWLGIMLVLLFSLELRVCRRPATSPLRTDPLGAMRTSILPAFTLGVALAAHKRLG